MIRMMRMRMRMRMMMMMMLLVVVVVAAVVVPFHFWHLKRCARATDWCQGMVMEVS